LSYPEHYADATHPNDEGCEIMAEVWFEAIKTSLAQLNCIQINCISTCSWLHERTPCMWNGYYLSSSGSGK
jgi:hypothetical protein